ncbi:MAG: metal-dependent transcriptional regulator [Acidimicrobiia bacterium]|nr:metal-dependent transcriptional regulator [Acidimicrobiia bacterium]
MIDHEHTTSEAEEMYIITVARAIEDGDGPPVSLSTLARELDVSSVSANQMVKKLELAGLMEYTPYKGVSLTEEGERLAGSVLRSRRLWGVFLVEHLGLTPRRADEVACEMEHVTPAEVADRLSEFLGDPSTGPQGRQIPGVEGKAEMRTTALGAVAVGERVRVLSFPDSLESFLQTSGLGTGSEVRVVAATPGASTLIESGDAVVHVAADVADAIVVSY